MAATERVNEANTVVGNRKPTAVYRCLRYRDARWECVNELLREALPKLFSYAVADSNVLITSTRSWAAWLPIPHLTTIPPSPPLSNQHAHHACGQV